MSFGSDVACVATGQRRQLNPDRSGAKGMPIRWEADIELPVTGDLVRFRETFAGPR